VIQVFKKLSAGSGSGRRVFGWAVIMDLIPLRHGAHRSWLLKTGNSGGSVAFLQRQKEVTGFIAGGCERGGNEKICQIPRNIKKPALQ